MAEKIFLRIEQIEAADSVEILIQFSMGRCHQLKGVRKGEYAMDLLHPYRLIFIKRDNVLNIVKIMDIIDYH